MRCNVRSEIHSLFGTAPKGSSFSAAFAWKMVCRSPAMLFTVLWGDCLVHVVDCGRLRWRTKLPSPTVWVVWASSLFAVLCSGRLGLGSDATAWRIHGHF